MVGRTAGIAVTLIVALVAACGAPNATQPVPVFPSPPIPSPEPAARVLTTDVPDGMAAIPAGAFVMGCDPDDPECDTDEKPAHPVRLRAFFIDRYEVTNAQYDACVAAGACARTPFL
ncbi:MAG: SUMF1/EgtB/PvdO family nonheme iron enzyme, partial [Deltaproteobacteria bacterium]|nr:SUMF1/EgtB/PvdO family nonheme iron enzyme [Deltaproteobacteria bacterium]